MKKRLIVVDISSFIFRAFYAVRLLHAPDGTPVNAIHGVLSMMLKLLEKYRPSHMVMARDTKGGSFRNEMYKEYKANRSAPPEELIPQFALIKELVNKLRIAQIEIENYEADDVIGTIATKWEDDFDEILIASGDKDLMQFVNDKVHMIDTMKDKVFDREAVFEKMGVWPEQIVDYLSMLGDASDNIPGMRGIGAKGAAKLLAEHKTLEECIKAKDTFTNKRVKTAFDDFLDDGLLSKELVQIVTDLDLGMETTGTELDFYPEDDLIEFLRNLGFKTSLKKLEDIKMAKDLEEGRGADESFKVVEEKKDVHFHLVDDKNFEDSLDKVKAQQKVSVEIAFKGHDNLDGIIGLAIGLNSEEALYFPFNHAGDEDLFGGKVPNLSQGSEEKVLEELLTSEKRLLGGGLKRLFSHSYFNDQEIKCMYFDSFIAQYILGIGGRADIGYLADKFLGESLSFQEGKSDDYATYEFHKLKDLCCEKALFHFNLESHLKSELERHELFGVYDGLENPLIKILGKMESQGVNLNQGYLKKLEAEYQTELDRIKTQIMTMSGEEEINLNSPKQVGTLLFEKLNLPVVKKTKTGYSTDNEVLVELDSQGVSEIPGLIIQHRELEKLLSTYIRVLPKLVHEKSNKIHTHFNQNVAATGRLSSDRPNLQNIPIRTEHGRKIRKGFMAAPGKLLLAADYSQVELRLLAHFSQDPVMVKAFQNDLDIHAQTASEVQGIALEEVTSSERSKAKAVNFGLMYGQSSFGLAKALRISRKEAKEYITGYFERFSRVKGYLDGLKDLCAETGYAETMYGRKRFLPDIHSQNRTVRSNAERMAINSPIQGTAADIIKDAMIAIQKEIDLKGYESKMVLQVHDELIFEVTEAELKDFEEMVPRIMENVCKLSVPLKVDWGVGVNWYDLK